MDSLESLKAGRLDDSLKALQQQVRSQPDKASHRIFLAQLLLVMGQWERALNQLNVAAQLDPLAIPMAQAYREAVQAERLRDQIFAGQRSPMVFGEPESWVALMVEALRADSLQRGEQAAALREQAFADAPAISGEFNGKPFAWIADADPTLGPILEALVDTKYYWIPLQRIHKLVCEAPVDLRDRVWLPAEFTWANGGQSVGLIPVRYPATLATGDHDLMLARRTEWRELPDGSVQGLGQRLFATDGDEYGLLDLRTLTLDLPEGAASGAVPDEAGGG